MKLKTMKGKMIKILRIILLFVLIYFAILGLAYYKYVENQINTVLFYPTVNDIHKRYVIKYLSKNDFNIIKGNLNNLPMRYSFGNDYTDSIKNALKLLDLKFLNLFNKTPTVESSYSVLYDSISNILDRYVFSLYFIHPKNNDTIMIFKNSDSLFSYVTYNNFILENIIDENKCKSNIFGK